MDSHFIFINNRLDEIDKNPILKFDNIYIDEISIKIKKINDELLNMSNDINNIRKLNKINVIDIDTNLLISNRKSLKFQKEEYETLIFNKNIDLNNKNNILEDNNNHVQKINEEIQFVNNEIEKYVKESKKIINTTIQTPLEDKVKLSFLEIRNDKKRIRDKKMYQLQDLEKYKSNINKNKESINMLYRSEVKIIDQNIGILNKNDFIEVEDKIKNLNKIKGFKDQLKVKFKDYNIKINKCNEELETINSKINDLKKIHLNFRINPEIKEQIEIEPIPNYTEMVDKLKLDRESLIKQKSKKNKKVNNVNHSDIDKLKKEINLYTYKINYINNNINKIDNVLNINTSNDEPTYITQMQSRIIGYSQKLNIINDKFNKILNN